ncbi:MAG TPA: hypothetical protein DEQ47_10590 [Solibacterales bacterium]|nr:hypothetical protein [Bryobacterales bacterium]
MRILLASNALYFPAHGGGEKSNRLLMEALAARGHDVRVATRTETFDAPARQQLQEDLAARGIAVESVEDGNLRFTLGGVRVDVLAGHPRLRQFFTALLQAFDPDIIVTSTDDPAQILFDAGLRAPRARVVHLVRATIAVPFGPDAASRDPLRAAMLARADGIVGVSEYVARYVREWGGMPAVHVPISLMDRTHPPNLAGFDHPYVTMINPCAVKGLPVFLELADARPDVAFAAVPTWGTTPEDIAALRQRANITLLPGADTIDHILLQTKVLLIPSLWAEARSRLVVESMARGIPVMSSNVGGMPEAKLGVDYLLPVNPIVDYHGGVDNNMVPVANIPPQDVTPWLAALDEVLGDAQHYEQLSAQSRAAALQYIESLTAEPFEKFLEQVLQSPKRGPAPVAQTLSADRQKLLAQALRSRAQAKPASPAELWLPGIRDGAGNPRLFCFPPAGAGQIFYEAWKAALAGVARLQPVVLPGRENRAAEPLLPTIDAIVAALAAVIEPYLETPYALFGHSMGGAIAFELARTLRRAGKPAPSLLFVSSVSAPRFRRQPLPPEPPQSGLLGQDIAAFRQHVYREEAPLNTQLIAMGGQDDPHVTREKLEAWRDETNAAFECLLFPGAHMYLRDAPEPVLPEIVLRLRSGAA